MDPAQRLLLPPVPPEQQDAPVAGWSEPVVMASYEPAAPTPYPVFADSRVYQGSSGRVYPLPFVDRVAEEPVLRTWQAVHLQNRWLRVMVLPELGGRIHLAVDRTNGYDLFLRQDVIKPALVGLAGPWVAGGVELNWPQHHRPATGLPVEVAIEHGEDGAVTVWCSDHDPFARMKGMHGVRLHPDRALLELTVRLYNRTEDTQTFLWWANAAARVHEDYQSFFPTDVTHVFDHAKRAVTTFPRAAGTYYGVDYPARVSAEDPDADRLDWWRNIPVSTSYMCVDTAQDFFGGYDHREQAGFVHWADHHVSPGKKMWTWGNAPFGRAWERGLSADGAPYIELMAGVFTDNQPDFSFLAPGETRAFSQWWYPLRGTGPVQQATLDAAARLDLEPDAERCSLRVAVAVTAPREAVRVVVTDTGTGTELAAWEADLRPGEPLVRTREVDPVPEHRLELRVEHEGRLLLRHEPRPAGGAGAPRPATEPPEPADVAAVEELVLTGTHLAQYRHATRDPEPYWQRALERDPGESSAHLALSATRYRAGDAAGAVRHARAALARLTGRNPNPASGEASYRLGLALSLQGGQDAAADDAWWKATWDAAWRSPARYALALSAARAGRPAAALDHVERCLVGSGDDLRARDLRVLLLRALGRDADAAAALRDTLRLDPLDWWARDLAGEELLCDAGTCLDVALDHAGAGALQDALRVLDRAAQRDADDGGRLGALLAYHRAHLLDRLGRSDTAARARAEARAHCLAGCFPSRLADAAVLQAALHRDPDDPAAAALLATWLYDRGRRREALALWRQAAAGPASALLWRNLALATYDVEGDLPAALACCDRAVELAPDDARLRWERDQLAQRAGEPPAARLERLQERPDLVAGRDDLTVEVAGLLCDLGRVDEAGALLLSRRFQPWEGGEGKVLAAWDRVCLLTARRFLRQGDAAAAQQAVRAALEPPESLGEARHPLANTAALLLCAGDAHALAGEHAAAREAWERAATSVGDFQDMAVVPVSDQTLDAALAWRRLGRPQAADDLLGQVRAHAAAVRAAPAGLDHFATSAPGSMLLRDDADGRRERTAGLLDAQASAGLGQQDDARARLARLLAADPGHGAARDLQARLPELAAPA